MCIRARTYEEENDEEKTLEVEQGSLQQEISFFILLICAECSFRTMMTTVFLSMRREYL